MSQDSHFDDELGRVLRQAGPRPTPTPDVLSEARASVRSEWRAMLKRRQRKRVWIGGAVAASLLAAVSLLLMPPPAIEQVASIDKLSGSIYVSTNSGELERASDLSLLHVGQSLRTGRDSVAGLMLASGASLRVASETSVVFGPDGALELRAGKLYVDSEPDPLVGVTAATDNALVIRTPLGSVTHIGTQYMVELTEQQLVVSVRAGAVEIDKAVRGVAGERLTTDGLGVDRSRISGWGADWKWAERATPAIDVEQQTADAFLRWVAHETGLKIEYRDAATEQNAATTVLSGAIEATPREALSVWVLAADYQYELDEAGGVIRIGRR